MFEFLRRWISTVIDNTKTNISVDFQLLYLWDTEHGFSIQSFIYLSNLCIFIFFYLPDSDLLCWIVLIIIFDGVTVKTENTAKMKANIFMVLKWSCM